MWSSPAKQMCSYCNNLNHYERCCRSKSLGRLSGEYKITKDNNYPAIVNSSRKVPFKLYARHKHELERMESLNVKAKVNEPTPWVNSVVIVEKKTKSLRVCLDPRNLNKAVQGNHYPLPSVEDIRSKLLGAKYFSTLDAQSGFWMLKLDQNSSFLTTFNTPFERFRFRRLPFGVSCAPEMFQTFKVSSWMIF